VSGCSSPTRSLEQILIILLRMMKCTLH
jgi:hypothetical protein